VNKLFDITLCEAQSGALLGITMHSGRARNWLSKFDAQSLRRARETVWVDCLAGTSILNQAAESRLSIGWTHTIG
jgi:hypothetical protein